MGVGVSVSVAVGVGVKVAVGVNVEVAVEVGVNVRVKVGVGVDVEVAAGGVPRRTMRGATHKALSCLGEPLALTTRMNFTFCPAKELKSISTG